MRLEILDTMYKTFIVSLFYFLLLFYTLNAFNLYSLWNDRFLNLLFVCSMYWRHYVWSRASTSSTILSQAVKYYDHLFISCSVAFLLNTVFIAFYSFKDFSFVIFGLDRICLSYFTLLFLILPSLWKAIIFVSFLQIDTFICNSVVIFRGRVGLKKFE